MPSTRDKPRSVLHHLALAVALAAMLVLAACSGGSDDDTKAKESGSFTVISYNVAGLPQQVSTEEPEKHIPLISPLLERYDIVMTQEDFDWWKPALDQLDFTQYHERLRADVTHEYQSARHPGPEAAGIDPATRPGFFIGDGLGFLSRYPITDVQRVAWKGCFGGLDTRDGGAADCLAIKGFAVATVELAPGAELDLYTLHVEAGGTEEDQRLQADDVDQLADFVEQHSAGRAVILGGDTNLHTRSDHPDASGDADTELWDGFLERTELRDTCLVLDCVETDAIDKIAYRDGGGVTLTPKSHEFASARFRGPDGEPLSDHEPLVVRFGWSATTS